MPDVASKLIERQIHRWNRIGAVLAKSRPKHAAGRHLSKGPVITISRQIGSGGRVVARELSERLDLDLFGVSIIDAVAKDASLERRIVDSLDENARSDTENWVASLLHGRAINNHEYTIRLAHVITTIATHGRAIILGRGGAYVLGERADLRLRFYAPLELRVKNMMQYENLAEEQARTKIAEVDENRALFVKRLFNAEIGDQRYYDLSINTSRVAPEKCADLICCALKARLSPERWEALMTKRAND